MTGKIKGDRYYSPNNVFSVEIPNRRLWNQKIWDESHDYATFAAFTNDVGSNVTVELHSIAKEELEKMEDKDCFQNEMESLLNGYLGDVENKSKVLKKQSFSDANFGNAFFYVIKIPNASGIICVEKNAEEDATQVHLYSLSKDYLIFVSVQDSPIQEHIEKITGKVDSINRMKNLLGQAIKVRRSIRFGGA